MGTFADLDIAIVVGVVSSLLCVIINNQTARSTVHGVSAEEDLIVPGDRSKGLRSNSDFKIFHFPSSLYFVNAEKFKNDIFTKVFDPDLASLVVSVKSPVTNDSKERDECLWNGGPHGGGEADSLKTVIIDCSAMSFIDIAGLNVLKVVYAKYTKVDIQVYLARCPVYMLKLLDRSDFYDHVPQDKIVYDIWDAIHLTR